MELENMTKAITKQASGIDETFPYKICINLDRRPDRWQQMQRKFDRHGIHSVRRFAAVDGDSLKLPTNWIHTPGAYGCLLSHVQVVREARQLGVASVLIFEDDVVFDDHLEKKFSACIEQLPPDWDMLFFGALHKEAPIMVSENMGRITQANSTYACAIKATVFDEFIDLNNNTEEVLDINSLVLQQRFNCYCFMPHLAWVEADHSDAQERLVHHWYLRESLVLFGAPVDRLLSETTIVFAHGDHTSGGSSTDNLMCLVNYYDKFFSPYIDMVIVEQGAQPTVNPASLPTNCKYVFEQHEGLFNRERCFTTGISHSNPSRKFVILSDNDIYLETLDIRANLRMCERYDCVTGFTKIVDLSKEDSRRLRNTKSTRGINIMEPSSLNNSRRGYCRFLNRDAIQISGGWQEDNLAEVGVLLPVPQNQQLRIFQSPNYALRLQQD